MFSATFFVGHGRSFGGLRGWWRHAGLHHRAELLFRLGLGGRGDGFCRPSDRGRTGKSDPYEGWMRVDLVKQKHC